MLQNKRLYIKYTVNSFYFIIIIIKGIKVYFL